METRRHPHRPHQHHVSARIPRVERACGLRTGQKHQPVRGDEERGQQPLRLQLRYQRRDT